MSKRTDALVAALADQRYADSLLVRFFASIEYAPSGCWLWIGGTSGGYAMVSIPGIKGRMQAHRVAYQWHVGPLVDGLEIDHICRRRNCVNPTHLEQVTHRTNTIRGVAPSAKHAIKTHCNLGHSLSDAYERLQGPLNRIQRICRSCSWFSGRIGALNYAARAAARRGDCGKESEAMAAIVDMNRRWKSGEPMGDQRRGRERVERCIRCNSKYEPFYGQQRCMTCYERTRPARNARRNELKRRKRNVARNNQSATGGTR